MKTQRDINSMTSDRETRREPRWLERMVRRMNRRHYNAIAHSVILRAYQDGTLNSEKMHIMCDNWNRLCWEERYRPQTNGQWWRRAIHRVKIALSGPSKKNA